MQKMNVLGVGSPMSIFSPPAMRMLSSSRAKHSDSVTVYGMATPLTAQLFAWMFRTPAR
jgi:hypothetical protein